MKRKDIIIINHDPLIERIRDGFVIDDLIKNGFNVKYIDLSKFYFPKIDAPYAIKEDYVIKFDNERDILDYLSSIDYTSTIVVLEAYANWKSRRIRKLLTDRKAKIVKIAIYPNNVLKKESLFRKMKHIGLKSLVLLFFYKIYQKIYNIKPPEITFSSNSLSGISVPINHPDYEEYLKSLKQQSVVGDNIVFIDECFPTHPEIKYWKGKDLNSIKDAYRRDLITLFDYLEKTLKKEVIICAHPKSDYKGDEFGHHKIIKGKTPDIVGQSSLVLIHMSTASSFAILYNKPIVLLSSEEYRHNIKSALDYQKSLAELLGLDIVDIDKWRPESIDDIPLINENKRQQFIHNFLSPKETKDKSNSEIIVGFLNDI